MKYAEKPLVGTFYGLNHKHKTRPNYSAIKGRKLGPFKKLVIFGGLFFCSSVRSTALVKVH